MAFNEPAMQFSVSLRRPAFRAPASARIQDEVIMQIAGGKLTRNICVIFGPNRERKSRIRYFRTGTFSEREIVVNFVRPLRIHAVRIEHGSRPFPRVAALKADASWGAGGKGQERRFVEALKIDGVCVMRGAQLLHCGDYSGRALG